MIGYPKFPISKLKKQVARIYHKILCLDAMIESSRDTLGDYYANKVSKMLSVLLKQCKIQ